MLLDNIKLISDWIVAVSGASWVLYIVSKTSLAKLTTDTKKVRNRIIAVLVLSLALLFGGFFIYGFYDKWLGLLFIFGHTIVQVGTFLRNKNPPTRLEIFGELAMPISTFLIFYIGCRVSELPID